MAEESHTIDVFKTLKDKSEKALQKEPPSTIHSVPASIRNVDRNAYTPRVVSIGTVHRHFPRLREMEDKKLLYMNRLFSRSQTGKNSDTLMQECVAAMQEEGTLKKVRACYTNEDKPAADTDGSNVDSSKIGRSVSLKKEEYVEIMVIDGCFVIEFLISSFEGLSETPIANIWELRSIKHDLMLMENQIPFFVLEKLFHIISPELPSSKDDRVQISPELPSSKDHKEQTRKEQIPVNVSNAKPDEKPKHPIADFVLMYFFEKVLDHCKLHNPEVPSGGRHVHILDFLHNYYAAPNLSKEKEDPDFRLYSATEIKLAGVKFRVQKKATHLLDVKFTPSCCFSYLTKYEFGTTGKDGNDKSDISDKKDDDDDDKLKCCSLWRLCGMCRRPHLEIPRIKINDTTKLLLRNLIAHEQTSFKDYRFFSQYAYMMDRLVNNEKDVRLLIESGIIENDLGSENELVAFSNTICKEITTGSYYFVEPWNQLERHYCKNLPRRIAALKGGYFSDTWVGIATIGACFLLAITVLQTVYTVLSYYVG